MGLVLERGPADAYTVTKRATEDLLLDGLVGARPNGPQKQLEPKVDWRNELPHTLNGAVATARERMDYTWTRPSRRASALPDIVLPGMWKPIPRVKLVLDTSASIGDHQTGAGITELGGILQALGGQVEVNVICIDSAVHSAISVFNADDVEVLGGGGTDLRVGIAHAMEDPPPPDVLIVVTDMETPWPEERPECDAIIICDVGTGQRSAWNTVPTWEHVLIHIPPQFDEVMMARTDASR
jgi:predicted metal-dependent peptidase